MTYEEGREDAEGLNAYVRSTKEPLVASVQWGHARLVLLEGEAIVAPTTNASPHAGTGLRKNGRIGKSAVAGSPGRTTDGGYHGAVLQIDILSPNSELPYADPHVRWCGRGEAAKLPPYPDSPILLRPTLIPFSHVVIRLGA